MRLNLNVACRHYKGCLFACRTCKPNGYACRFASPFIEDFSRRSRVCGYGHGFACFCRGYVFRAVHNNYIILSNSQVSCLKGYVICRHIELDFLFGQVHIRGVKSRNFPLVKIHIGCRLVCFYGDFRLIRCLAQGCRSVCDGYAVRFVFKRCRNGYACGRHYKGCFFACRTCKLNRNPCRFASPFNKLFAGRNGCVYSNRFAIYCFFLVCRTAVYGNSILYIFIICSCRYSICRHIKGNAFLGGIKSAYSINRPTRKFLSCCRLVCGDSYACALIKHTFACSAVYGKIV